MKLLFFGKHGDYETDRALDFCENFADVESYLGEWNTRFPEGAEWWRGEYIISYLSRWIIPDFIIRKASIAAMNFHPGPPEYPGVGCVNFALYDNVESFGVTCHYLAHPVDSGGIIKSHRFSVFPWDDVESILERTHHYLLGMFYEVMGDILQGKTQPTVSTQKWTRKAFTRQDLDELAEITADMSNEEIDRRARAVTYQNYGLTIRHHRLLR